MYGKHMQNFSHLRLACVRIVVFMRKWCYRIDSKLANGVQSTGIGQSVDKTKRYSVSMYMCSDAISAQGEDMWRQSSKKPLGKYDK